MNINEKELWLLLNDINNENYNNDNYNNENYNNENYNEENAITSYNEKSAINKTDNEIKIGAIKCLSCGAIDNMDYNEDVLLCMICGAENGQQLDDKAEWRYFGSEDTRHNKDPTRCNYNSMPSFMTSLSTTILGSGTQTYRRMNQWNSTTYKERSCLTILNYIKQKAILDKVPQKVIDKTYGLYELVIKSKVRRGKKRERLIIGCYLHALRSNGIIKDIDELCKLFNITASHISKGYNEFINMIEEHDKSYVKNIKSTSLSDYIDKYGYDLNINDMYIEIIKTIALRGDKINLCHQNNTKSTAIGYIYFTSISFKLGLTKRYITEITKISDITLTHIYNALSEEPKIKRYLLKGIMQPSEPARR